MIVTKMTSAVVICILFLLGLAYIYFTKERMNNEENKVYKALLVLNIIGLVFHILADLVSYHYDEIPLLLSTFVLKTYLIYYLAYGVLLLSYLCIIAELKHKKIYAKILISITCIIYVVLYFLPQEIYRDVNKMIFYTNGIDVKLIYILSAVLSIILFTIVLTRLKKIDKKKAVPLFLFLIAGTISIIIQKVYPHIVVIDCIESIIVLLMYFTIENPDLKLLRQAERAQLHAEQANRAKSDFLSSMSHEIRTPLNAIVGFSEDIRDYIDSGDNERIKEDADLIVSSSETLLEIVGNIIDISKIESEKLDIVEKVYKPKEEIEKLTKATATRIGDKPIDFHLYIASDIPYELIGDSGKVKQVINNLLTNSIKYTEKGEINLRIDCINQNNMSVLKISCQDTGRGIKKENIEKLFTKFERLDIEKNTTTEGTGLGLAITKSLVEMMGGKINVQSRFGEGSIFIAQIPQKIKTLMSPTGNVEEINNPIKEAHIEAQPRIVNSENNNNIKKVLIVDDNKLNITVAKKVLEEIVEEVESVMSGKECLDKINAGEKYDVILMDIMMPEMSGETTFKKLKEIDGFNIPVIALTADAESTSRAKYLSEGFNDYIAKPFKKDEIKSILDKYSKSEEIIETLSEKPSN